MADTSKGTLWELTHSLWILWTLAFGFLSWVSFFYIGFRTKQRKWILWGLIYSSSAITAMLIGPTADYSIMVPEDSWIMDLQIFYFFGLWLISIFHAFWVRKEYLLRLEAISDPEIRDEAYLKRKYAMEYTYGNEEKSKFQNPFKRSSVNSELKQEHVKDAESLSKPVDINNDPEEVIAELPGVGSILAKKAVETRQLSPFKSVDEFGEILGLKPHIIERVRPLIVISSEFPDNEESETSTSGRLVDY
ncbi:ComEA family DNA-binding protein [Methanobacterium sp. MBAC-LM]|uniref:ComEA family DNA-binding protein n=1 Tax=Methanobacterium sp. MBAC-LM TaxID=3412034 RepID=UPI003C72DBF5